MAQTLVGSVFTFLRPETTGPAGLRSGWLIIENLGGGWVFAQSVSLEKGEDDQYTLNKIPGVEVFSLERISEDGYILDSHRITRAPVLVAKMF